VPAPLAKRSLYVVAAATMLALPAHSQDVDQSLQLYAVHVVRYPKENWTGQGVYLGNGLVLTAGHVAGSFLHTVHVEIAGQELPTEVLKRGSFSNTDPADVDLALISIDDTKLPVSLRLRRMTLCKPPPRPNEEVIVATPEGIARSHVIPPNLIPPGVAAKFHTAISDVATTGNSGSGVFDARAGCLLGIVSAKIQGYPTGQRNKPGAGEKRDIAKVFVPASTIADFIPPQYRF
jgi:hypothetical protein